MINYDMAKSIEGEYGVWKISRLFISALCTALTKENILVTCVRRFIAKAMGLSSRANLDARTRTVFTKQYKQLARGNLDAQVRTVFP